jgi:hypothetical protein
MKARAPQLLLVLASTLACSAERAAGICDDFSGGASLCPEAYNADIGACCELLGVQNSSVFPRSEAGKISLKFNLRFNCESAICVSQSGGAAYCTAECADARDCPEGFQCADALENDPGENSALLGKRFCLRETHACGP